MTQERKFAKNLTGPGTAARLRETVSVALRECSQQSKPKLVEPLDYETVIVKNRTLLHNDPHREMLLFPLDDVSQSTLPRRFRTVRCSVPPAAIQEATSLLVRECIKAYTMSWSVIHYKYTAYSGTYLHLPSLPKPEGLPEHVFEVDAEADGKEEEIASRLRPLHITKQGWLYKGPDSGSETSIISFTRSFKRRYFYLKQQADTTYIMEFHKDDRKLEAKGSIFLDSATDVRRSSRRGKHSFELLMQDKSFYLFAAESETEVDEWVGTLKKVITTTETNGNGINSDRVSRGEPESSPGKGENFRESLEHSMNPELQKYARETDSLLAQQRRSGRQKLYNIYPEIQESITGLHNDLQVDLDQAEVEKSAPDDVTDDTCDVEVYKQHFGSRIIIRCEDFRLRLQANMADESQVERLSNPEPVFIALALYDAREGKKISEDFHFDPNSEEIRNMIPKEVRQATDMLNTVDGATSKQPDLNGLDEEWMAYPRLAVFSVTKPSPDIYMVARIEKVLQGSISMATDPYMRTPDIKVGTKIHRQMKQYCARLGHYRMPLAWAARPVFKPYTQELDSYSDFVLYRQEGSKISEEDLIKHLQDMKKPEKQGKWLPILGTLKINMYAFKSTLTNTLTSSLLAVKPFSGPNSDPPACEVAEFMPKEGECAQPFVTYTNHLYVYPRMLKYDGQKAFPKARNLVCYVEIRDSDDEHAVPLRCIYGKPGGSTFTTCSTAAVLHHNASPDFNEEVKLLLPSQLHDHHHLVFSFFHVSCELSKAASVKGSSKKAGSSEVPVGAAWFPLLVNGRVNGGEQHVRVAMSLPPGYLSYEQLGMGKGAVGPDIRWVDGGRPLFKFNLRLNSTTYTKDQHMHNFFAHCQKMENSPTTAINFETNNRLKNDSSPGTTPSTDTPYDREMLRQVKSLHAVDVSTLINFLPVLFNQLFRLLTKTNSDDVAMNSVRVLIHAASEIIDVGKPEILHSYVKYVFVTESVASTKQKSVHEELAKHLKGTLRPTQADQLVIGKFLKHSWFFFDMLIKSMAQHLLSTGRIKMARNERFPSSFQFHIQTLVQTLTSHITQKSKEAPSETKCANISLANFVKKCFTFMDRGFVFRLINMYIDNFGPGDPKLLHEYKFEFLQIICNHEHYIQLNLPIMRKTVKNYKDLKHDYTLSDEFRQNHFLVGLLLHEVKMALNENREIRKYAITTLRNLLAKHSFDNRYSTKAHQARISTLYLPFLTIILENKARLSGKESTQSTPSPAFPNGDSTSMGLGSASGVSGHAPQSQPETPVRSAPPSLPSYNSSVSLDSSMSPYSATSRLALRDPGVFAMIAGQATSMQNLGPSLAEVKKDSHHGSSSSLTSNASSKESNATTGTTGTLDRERERRDQNNTDRQSMIIHPSLQRTHSFGNQPPFMLRYDKLNTQEIKDLLICFLFIVKSLSEEILLGWFNNSSESDVLDFLSVLEICIQTFIYIGKKRIMNLCIIGDSKRAMTLPVKKGQAIQSYIRHSSAAYNDIQQDALYGMSQAETDASLRALLEANLSSEVAMVVLDVVCLYTNHFKDQLQFRDGANPIMEKVFDLHLHFMQVSQSEMVQRHAFGALRSFISKFPKVLFQGEASMCGSMCYEILRCCNSRLNSTRSEACALMYLLMRSNFEFSQRKSFTRTHLQEAHTLGMFHKISDWMIISVSQLISDVVGLSNMRFTDSLSIINSYANNDKAMQRTVFPVEVKDLTKRIRTVLMATAQMKEHQNDPEMLVDLQYSLAKSYASTPELRRTWLEAMARIHMKNNDFSEAAHCYIHIAALVAEYLRRRGKLGKVFPQGCRAFKNISPNVEPEESGMRDDSGMQDVQYTEDDLTGLLEECALLLEKAERYELLGEVYRLIIPIYEKTRQYEKLAAVYGTLQKAYTKIVDVLRTGKRLLGKYFRVAFFGQVFFEEEDGKEYIYKEPKITGLTEICDRLKNMYGEKYGKGNVHLIMDSAKVNTEKLNPRLAYIQVTYVTPYFEEKELEDRQTDFERNNNIRRFMFETPFTKNGKPRGEIAEQFKRRTVLTTSHSFPYVKKRILVVYHKECELTPIEVAIDAMQNKVVDLEEVVSQSPPDLKKIQLKLQGSVSVQVNAGPVAYAEAFLADDKVHKYRRDKVSTLKETFRNFVHICNLGLDLNGRLINTDQYEYQEALRTNFKDLADRLSDIFGESLLEDDKQSSVDSHRGSVTVFNMISTTPNNTSQV